MIFRTVLAIVFATFACAAGAQSPLPPKMAGMWQDTSKGHSNKVEVELVRMVSPTEATIRVAWLPYCPWAETRAVFRDGAWRFSPQSCTRDLGNRARLRPVEGKNRLEGTYGSSDSKTMYLEWD